MKNRFGYEWSRYKGILPAYEEQFLKWVAPLKPGDFKDKTILDAGCGTGRNSLWPLKYGAKQVDAFDVDPRTVEVAKENLTEYKNARVFQQSIYDSMGEGNYDLAFSIGVIHHLADPRKALANMLKAVRPGGSILIWVYGKEGFTWLKMLIKVLLPMTSKLPPSLLNVLVAPFSALMFLSIKIMPAVHPYLKTFKNTTFWHIHSIVFDQLLPEIANYWTHDEVKELFSEFEDLESVKLYNVNRGSWTAIATKQAD